MFFSAWWITLKKEKATYLSSLPFFYGFFLFFFKWIPLSISQPEMWWRSRIESQNQPTAIFFSIISQAKTNGMEWLIFYTLNCLSFVHYFPFILHHWTLSHIYWLEISSINIYLSRFFSYARLEYIGLFLLHSDTHTIDDNEV